MLTIAQKGQKVVISTSCLGALMGTFQQLEVRSKTDEGTRSPTVEPADGFEPSAQLFTKQVLYARPSAAAGSDLASATLSTKCGAVHRLCLSDGKGCGCDKSRGDSTALTALSARAVTLRV